jgi:hypothetical protein
MKEGRMQGALLIGETELGTKTPATTPRNKFGLVKIYPIFYFPQKISTKKAFLVVRLLSSRNFVKFLGSMFLYNR